MKTRLLPRLLALLALLSGLAGAASATPKLDTGDTAFMFVCMALVLLMTPGLALFYGGLVQARSVLNTMMMCIAALGVAGVAWTVLGYSLAFGEGGGSWFGGLGQVGLAHIIGGVSGTIPTALFAAFQITFAVITLAVVSGSVVERMRFPAFLLFGLLWVLCVYAPLAHWVWDPNGWLYKRGLLDLAGGTVVETASGVSGLVAALVIGRRSLLPRQVSLPHNVPFVLLGTGLLWFGWMGFNAGSALAMNQVAAMAALNTLVAPAAALLVWILWEVLLGRKPSAVGVATGAVVGMVAITPGCGFVTPLAAVLIGAVCSTASFWLVANKHRLPDDALDVFACHGLAGILGTLLTGVFAVPAVNSAGTGLLAGNPGQVGIQALGVLSALLLAGGGSFVLLKLIGLVMPLRVTERQETMGLDLTAHEEEGYREAENSLSAPVMLGGD